MDQSQLGWPKNQFPDVWSGTKSRSLNLFTKSLPGLSASSPRAWRSVLVLLCCSLLTEVRELGPVSRTKATKTSLNFHAIFKKIYLKNKAGRQETLFIWKIVMGREQLCKLHGPVVQGVDNAIHRINDYPVDSIVCFVSTYPLDSDLSGWQCPNYSVLLLIWISFGYNVISFYINIHTLFFSFFLYLLFYFIFFFFFCLLIFYFLFFLVSGCSRMFWNVPCSGFMNGHSGLCLK